MRLQYRSGWRSSITAVPSIQSSLLRPISTVFSVEHYEVIVSTRPVLGDSARSEAPSRNEGQEGVRSALSAAQFLR